MKLSAADAMLLALAELRTGEPAHRRDLFRQVWAMYPERFTFSWFKVTTGRVPCSKTMNETLVKLRQRRLVYIERPSYYALTRYGEGRVADLREALAGIPAVPS